MPDFFAERNFIGTDHSALHQNARLAVHVALFLGDTQDRDGSWPGSHLAQRLRYTCHALEALQLLGAYAFPAVIDRGQHWLINLAEEISDAADEWTTVRLHPSRFKTLAKLRALGDAQVQQELVEACKRVNDQGQLSNIIQDPMLGSIILSDCLLELSNGEVSPALRQEVLERTLPAIETALAQWCEKPNRSEDAPRYIDTIGSASYAFDILLRTGRSQIGSPYCTAVRNEILNTLASAQTMGTVSKDLLYSAIQAGLHFRHDEQVRNVVEAFFDNLRFRYDDNQIQRQDRNDELQPLVLRALLTYGDQEFSAYLEGMLWNNMHERINQDRVRQEKEQRQRFEELIRRRTQIRITQVTELSGGLTDARVFRVDYDLDPYQIHDENGANGPRFSVHSIVVKTGSRARLNDSVQRYMDLRSDVRHYFAQHTQQPEIVETGPFAPAYLILEDLSPQYRTLREIFSEIDRHSLSAEARETIQHCTKTIVQSLFGLYTKTQRRSGDVVGLQISRLYLSRLDRSLIDMCKPGKVGRVKDFLSGFWLRDKRFDSIETYQARLYHHRDMLRPPCLMLMHGDCHGRNIMLDSGHEHMKLIDLDKLDAFGDYIMDFALLIEDMALFRRLFDKEYRHYLRTEQIELPVDRVAIDYPPFVTELGLLFQELLLQHVDAYAQELNDTHYRVRLWLAIALYLLRLVEKESDAPHAIVVYVEAVKLLDALVEYLDRGKALPPIPIEKEHPKPADVAQIVQAGPADAELAEFHQLVMNLQTQSAEPIRYDVRSDGRSIRYFFGREREPFAILDGKRRPPGVLLTCPVTVLEAAPGYVQSIRTAGAFHSVIRPPDNYSLETVHQLLEKAVRHLLN